MLFSFIVEVQPIFNGVKYTNYRAQCKIYHDLFLTKEEGGRWEGAAEDGLPISGVSIKLGKESIKI